MSEGGNCLTGGDRCQEFRFAEQAVDPPTGPGVKDTLVKPTRSTSCSWLRVIMRDQM